MTAVDLAALLRADPERGADAMLLAKIAGPWRQYRDDGHSVRDCWSALGHRPEGLVVAANDQAREAHDKRLRAEGWALSESDDEGEL